jgi:predicted permease
MRNPVLSCAIVMTLSLGIGVNAGVFTVINGLMLRARVDNDAESFVHLAPQVSGKGERIGLPGAVSLNDYRAYQAGARSLKDLAGWAIARVKVDDDPNETLALLVTEKFFSIYGLGHLKLGRVFLPDECSVTGAAPVAVLSEEIWRNRFNSDPAIIGSVISLNRRPFTVVGVTPARFSGRLRGRGIWIPYTQQAQFFAGRDFFRETDAQWLTLDGRLAPGQTRQAAQIELDRIAKRQDRLRPGRQTTMVLTNGSLIEEPALRAKVFWAPPLIMGALTLVLLIACLNVTVLLLSRAAARQREIAIRLALGAGRGRLLRMLITESLILAVAAGAVSAYLAYQIPGAFERTLTDAPNYPLKPDLRVFAYLAGVTLLAGGIAGLAPAIESLKVNLSASLNGLENLLGGGAAKWRARDFLVGAQVALSMVALALAGLFVRAQYTALTADPGFDTRQTLVVRLETETSAIRPTISAPFYRAAQQRVRALPGVLAVCLANSPPGQSGELDADSEEMRLPGQPREAGRAAGVNFVSGEFFDTFRIPIVAGRTFHESDVAAKDAAAVIIVSETFARTFWPGGDPLGKVIEDARGDGLLVAGVARDTKSSFGAAVGPQFYRPLKPGSVNSPLMVRFVGDAPTVTDAIRKTVQDVDPRVTVSAQTLRFQLEEGASKFWVTVRLILSLGIVAALLAVIGIYGVVAAAVNRRAKEMGIRLALGATKLDIIRLVLWSGAKPILAGLVVGGVSAMACGRVMARVLQVTPFALEAGHPQVYIAVAVLLLVSATFAMLGPSFRAANADPIRALRQD